MNLTVMICARNAAATIERAVASVLPEAGVRLLLADDHSHDDTVERARRLAGSQLVVVSVPDPGGVCHARQVALDNCETEFAAWLDADDAWVAGRAEQLMTALTAGADVACDAIDLCDGTTGSLLRRLDVPSFIRREPTPARLFERNHLPGDSQVGFRVAAFREAGGYDSEVFGVESFDLLLRAISRGARFAYSDTVGYRMYAYAGSVSRDLGRQRASLARALKKHDYARVRDMCLGAGQPSRVAAWVLVSMALFRGEPEAALGFLDAASPASADPDEILEPDGPWPLCEGWRRAFQRGTCLLLLGGRDVEALQELRRAEELDPTAEGANNLGVALIRMGQSDEAAACFAEAQRRFPGYLDARLNAAQPTEWHITSHPLRRQASRSEY